MTLRVGWLSPLTPASGVGTFSHAVTRHFPSAYAGEAIDLTILHPAHARLYRSDHRTIQIEESTQFHRVLSLFDVLVYNIGNNREHHDAVIGLLRVKPGIVVCHDHVYQHYLAERSLRGGKSFASYAALLTSYGGADASDYIKRSRITSRAGAVRYSPWDSEYSSCQPMSDSLVALGSALVVHSAFTRRYVERSFSGPILQLGMPYDQKPEAEVESYRGWQRQILVKQHFHLMSFGFIQSTKCIELVLSAIGSSSVLRRHLRYTVAGYVGDAAYLHHLRDLVATLALDDVVDFELDVSEVRLAALSIEADVFVNLRRPNTEGSSASLIEQLAKGKPVVVLASGCYAEIPPGAAVSLPADASSDDVRDALLVLLGKPERMLAIGRAGREFAQTLSCESYAERLADFLFAYRRLLQDRSEAIGSCRTAGAEAATDSWRSQLGRARRSLHYLDRNMLALDPAIVARKSGAELCRYLAEVIFGSFDDEALVRTLARYFAGKDRTAIYWDCVRFALVADAAFGDDASASRRLQDLGPCYAPEFWAVIVQLPMRCVIAAGSTILSGCRAEDRPGPSAEDRDLHAKRRRLAEYLSGPHEDEHGATQLRRWLEQAAPEDGELPVLEDLVEWVVGSDRFAAGTELSGFYGIETNLVWTRGARGLVGLRPGTTGRIEMLVRHVDADSSHPCEIMFGIGRIETKIEVCSTDPVWIAFDVAPAAGRESVETVWFQLSATRAARPSASADTRVLGVAIMGLRFTPRADRIAKSGRPRLLTFDGKAA